MEVLINHVLQPGARRENLEAKVFGGANAIGIMLIGIGKDGATAMMDMKRAGSYNIAQNEASCVVFGLRQEAIAGGGVDEG